eukprot:SAG25_NODE_238_length_11236_cov_37.046061_5_plen_83_part_00
MERMTGDWKLLAADTDDSQLTCGGDRCVRDCCQAPCRSGTIDSSASQVAEQGRRRRGGSQGRKLKRRSTVSTMQGGLGAITE